MKVGEKLYHIIKVRGNTWGSDRGRNWDSIQKTL